MLQNQPDSPPVAPRRKRPKLIVLIGGGIVGVCVLAGIAASIFLVSGGMTAPLGPTLVPLEERIASGTAGLIPISTPPIPTLSAPPVPANQIETVCGGPPEMLVLAVGSDLLGLADVIRLVRVDFVTPRISVMAFPRDLWVPMANLPLAQQESLTGYFGIVPDLSKDQLGYGRINTAYSFGNAYDLPGGGAGTLADTLYLNFGIKVEHYGAVKMESMGGLIDILGGIDINVPYAVPGFAAGPQHMNGDQAVNYARVRSTDDDWHRQDRQTLVLKAMREQMIEREAIGDLPRIVDLALKDIQTDLSREQIGMLTCIGLQVPEEDFMNYQLTRDYITSARTTHGSYVLVPRYDKIAELIAKFMSGIPQDQPLP